MASIVERKLAGGKKSYQVTIRLKGFHTQTASFARMTDAKRWAGATEAAMREGRYFRTSQARKHTLSDLIDRYIKEVIPSKGRFGKDQETQLKWWKDQLGPYLICDIAPAMIAEGRDRLLAEKTCRKKLRSPATVVRYLAALSHAFSVAVKEWEWISENPATKVRKPREPEGRTRFLNPAEIKRLMDTCRENPNPFLYPIVVLALSSGMRFSEILRLRWEDIDLERQLLVIKKTKNKERRTIPLAGPALELLRELESQSPSDVGLVFTVEGSKKPVDIRNAWLRAKVEAEISNFRFHDLRHTAASYLAMNGATTLEIAEILGHKTLAMVKRYAHLSEPHTRGVIESLVGKLFDGQSEEGGDDPVVKDGAVLYRTAA
jgi:integrase